MWELHLTDLITKKYKQMKLQQILIFLGYTVIKNNNYYILLENDREHQLLI